MSYLRIFVPRRWVELDTRSPLKRNLKLSHMQRLMAIMQLVENLYYQDEEDIPLSVLQDMYRLFPEDSDDDEFGGF
jgi:hypothetical protein